MNDSLRQHIHHTVFVTNMNDSEAAYPSLTVCVTNEFIYALSVLYVKHGVYAVFGDVMVWRVCECTLTPPVPWCKELKKCN